MQGFGKTSWPDGRFYEGNYYNDKKHGQGNFQWSNGNRFEGEWKNGKQNGKGVIYLFL